MITFGNSRSVFIMSSYGIKLDFNIAHIIYARKDAIPFVSTTKIQISSVIKLCKLKNQLFDLNNILEVLSVFVENLNSFR